MGTTVYSLTGAFFMLSFTSGVLGQCEPSGKLTLKADSEVRYLQSPDYPVRYSSNLKCQWVLEAANEQQRVRLQSVRPLDLENVLHCIYDRIELFDGPKATGKGIIRCGGNVTMTSTGRYLTLTFTSDNHDNGTGFKFRYTAVDAWELETTTLGQQTGGSEATTSGKKHTRKEEVTTLGQHTGAAEVMTSEQHTGRPLATTSGQHDGRAEVTGSWQYNGSTEVTTSWLYNGGGAAMRTENLAGRLIGWVTFTVMFGML